VRWLRLTTLSITVAVITVMATGCASASKNVTSQTAAATKSPGTSSSSPAVLASPSAPVGQPTAVALSVPSADVVWALVDGSLLYRSTDRGATWQQRPVPPGNFPHGEVSFIDDHQGWLATGGVPETQCNGAGTVIWHTTDAGNSWREVTSVDWEHLGGGGIGYRQCKEGLSFIDPMQGYLDAWDPNSRPTIYRTADGGHTWNGSTLPDPPGFVTWGAGDALTAGLAKRFGTTLLLPASGMQPNASTEMGYIFRSIDGGATWTSIAATGNGIDNVTLVTASRWLKISNDRSALETIDAGRTWHPFSSDYQVVADGPSRFVFGDPQIGYGTAPGAISRTVDGGLHWTEIKLPGA
jgi:photosystem II stability/assembly factor-like uncharacterized protein